MQRWRIHAQEPSQFHPFVCQHIVDPKRCLARAQFPSLVDKFLLLSFVLQGGACEHHAGLQKYIKIMKDIHLKANCIKDITI
jgi:hypothetical protein